MNYFICALGAVHLGIPAERTERIIAVSRVQTVVYETENQESFISLPLLFRLDSVSVPHGVLLKGGDGRTILLTPKIDIALEIPEDKIHSLPEALSGLGMYVRGAYFGSQGVILVLDPDKIAGSVK